MKEIFKMSESSDSDYNVEDYIKPEVVRRTYNNEDLLTDDDEDDDSESSEAHSDHEVNNSQCKVKKAEKPEREDEEEQEEEIEAPRANSRYILYVTNLSPETTRSMLEDFFTDAGQIKSIRIPKVRLGSFAFVEMMDIEGFKVNKLKLLKFTC